MVRIQAIYDYNGSADHIITFAQGDEFELIDDSDPNWWHVTLPHKGNETPEHIYVPATYVQIVEEPPAELPDDFPDLPPPPTDEELASISSTDITVSETSLISCEKVAEPAWIASTDDTGRTYYFNTKTETSQWDKPEELRTPNTKRKSEEQHYASLMPKEQSEELRKPVNAASAVEDRGGRRDYMNVEETGADAVHYANLATAGAGGVDQLTPLSLDRQQTPLSLDRQQTTGQTTKNETTQQTRKKHSSPSPTHSLSHSPTPSLGISLSSPFNVSSLARESPTVEQALKRGNTHTGSTSTRPMSIAGTTNNVAASPNRRLLIRQLSDQLSPPKSRDIGMSPTKASSSILRRSVKKSIKCKSPTEAMNDTIMTLTSLHGKSSFMEPVTISCPQPTPIPKQILDGYTEKREDGDIVYICKQTQDKWRLIRSGDKIHYQNKRSEERVWTLPVYKSAARTFSGGSKKSKSEKLPANRSLSMSDYYRSQNANEPSSPVVKLEGLIKRKILQAPHDVKVDNKSWCSYYGVLKANTVYFYKDAKHYKRNESESACELSEDSTLHVDEDKKKGKLIKVCKKNGLEMLLRAGDKAPTVEDWLESLSSATGTPISSLHNNRSVSEGHIDSVNGHDSSEDRVDARSIIDSKDITKKTINNYLHNRPTKDAQKIVDILTHQGIDISHLDKEKKKKVLTQLLSTRPSLEDLQRKGLIKYTVFGCPLSSLCSRQRVQVPSVVTACVEAIEFRGLRSPGLYRISGNSAAIQKLRFKFDRCEDKYESINLKDQEFEINMLTGFLKLFLRELPEPVIPFSQYNGIAIAIRTEEQSPETAVQMLKHIVQNLPEPNKSTLIYLILHIVRVSNESSENQMDVHNLSIIFGPSLLGNQPDKANLLADLPVQNRAIELIISHYRTILR